MLSTINFGPACPQYGPGGDANGRGALTHTSYNDYEILAASLFDDDPCRISDRITAYAVYIDLQLGRAGPAEREVRASGRKAFIAKMAMTQAGRARERSENQNFMKILIEVETDRIPGAVTLGIGGDEVVHSLLDVMYGGAPYTAIQRAVHIHPIVSGMISIILGGFCPMR